MRNDPTTITWLTLPRNGNGGAALVDWNGAFGPPLCKDIGYLLGDKPSRYPMPAIPTEIMFLPTHVERWVADELTVIAEMKWQDREAWCRTEYD